MLVLRKPGPKLLFCINIRLLQSSENKLWSRRLRRKRNFEIVVILNKYYDILNDLINSSDPEFFHRAIDEKFRNTPRSEGVSISLLKKNYLDKHVLPLNRSSHIAPKIKNSQFYQHHVILLFGLKSWETWYRKV